MIGNCIFPDHYLYDVNTDTWAMKLEDDVYRVGLVSFMVYLSGPVSKVHFVGDLKVAAHGRNLATYESLKYFGSVKSPVDGKIVRLNASLESEPRLLSYSPYDEGWVAEIEAEKTSHLAYAQSVADLYEAKIRDLKVKCYKYLPDRDLVSIGSECAATIAALNDIMPDAPAGYVVRVVSDDLTAPIELTRWAAQTGNELVESRKEDNLFHIIVRKK
ncbi:MAG: hypothetical protein QW767_03045 [Thermoprotei archaeon]